MKPVKRGALASTLLVTLCASGMTFSSSLVHAQPDFTGVWRSYNLDAPNTFRRGAASLPLTDIGAERVAEYQALIGDSGVTPGQLCLGSGMPGSMLGSGAYPMEIIQRPEQITVIYEAHSEIRRLFVGENRFPESERFPDRNGYSEAQWQGDTLHVTTTHLKEQADQTYAHSDQARISERYSMYEDDEGVTVLRADMTLVDPVFYTEPVEVTKAWARMDNGRLLPYECNEPAWEEYLDNLRTQ